MILNDVKVGLHVAIENVCALAVAKSKLEVGWVQDVCNFIEEKGLRAMQ